jgi:hypothetical protein
LGQISGLMKIAGMKVPPLKGIIIYIKHQNLVNDQTCHESARMQHWAWILGEFGPKFQYLPGPENVVADALSHLDKAPSPSDDKEDTDYTHKPANCFSTLDVDFLNPSREDGALHLAENVFSGAHKDDIVYPLSAQQISKHQQKDREFMKKIRDNLDTLIQFSRERI